VVLLGWRGEEEEEQDKGEMGDGEERDLGMKMMDILVDQEASLEDIQTEAMRGIGIGLQLTGSGGRG